MLPFQEGEEFHENLNATRRKRFILIMIIAWGFLALVSMVRDQPSKQNPANQNPQLDQSSCQAFYVDLTEKISHNNPPDFNSTQQSCLGFQILKTLSNKIIRGQWSDVPKQALFEENNLSGLFVFRSFQQSSRQVVVKLLYFDGDYLDDLFHEVFIFINDNNLETISFDEDQRQLNLKDQDALIRHSVNGQFESNAFNEQQQANSSSQQIQQSIFHQSLINTKKFSKIVQLTYLNYNFNQIQIVFSSGKIQNIDYEHKSFMYSCFVSIIGVIQIICSLRAIKLSFEQSSMMEHYSLITLTLATSQDAFLSLFHFYFGVALDLEHFITPGFLYFLLFSIFEMRLVILIWRMRQEHLVDNRQLRSALLRFYLFFYGLMFGLNYLMLRFPLSTWLLMLQSLILVPQIIRTAMNGQFVQGDFWYAYGLIGTRVLLIWYFKGCPGNMFEFRPNYLLCGMVTCSLAIQLIIYYLQTIRGPRFFVPRFLLPKSIPNNIDLENNSTTSEIQSLFKEECSVCMMPLHETPQLTLNDQENRNMQLKQILDESKGKIMKTPCNHKFHSLCLAKWMTIKLNCPSCRSQLPAL